MRKQKFMTQQNIYRFNFLRLGTLLLQITPSLPNLLLDAVLLIMFISVYIGAELCWTLFFLLHFSLITKTRKFVSVESICHCSSSFHTEIMIVIIITLTNYIIPLIFFLLFFSFLTIIIQLWYTIHEWWSIPSYFSFLFPCDLFFCYYYSGSE